MQALVQEFIVQCNDLIDCPHLSQLVLELVEIGFQNLKQHIVEVVLAKLQHLVPGPVGLRKHVLNVALFGRLVNGPSTLERVLDVLLEEQVTEYQLVLVQNLFADDKAQWPLDVVLQCQSLVDFEAALLADASELAWV